MAKRKLKWVVSPAPTGEYRSFQHRPWPHGEFNGEWMVLIWCKDKYVPANVRSGNHGELTIAVTDRRHVGGAFVWRTIKRRANTLDEAKKIAQAFFEMDANTAFFGLEKKP
jgi:hypothetical protein